MWDANPGVQNDRLETGPSAPPHLLTPREQQWAIGIGIIAGAAGGYAVFTTSNQAGTFMLLLIALVFLLLGLAGTPLLRQLRRPARPEPARHGRRSAEPSAQTMRLMEDVSGSEPSLVPGTEPDGIPNQAEWPGGDDSRS